MSEMKADRLGRALQDLLGASPDVEAAAVVSFDGLVMASALPHELEEDRIGAMSAALLSLGEQAVAGLKCGELRQLFAEGSAGFVFLMSARDEAVLAAVTNRHAKIGFILYELQRSADAIGQLLATAPTAVSGPPPPAGPSPNPYAASAGPPLPARPNGAQPAQAQAW